MMMMIQNLDTFLRAGRWTPSWHDDGGDGSFVFASFLPYKNPSSLHHYTTLEELALYVLLICCKKTSLIYSTIQKKTKQVIAGRPTYLSTTMFCFSRHVHSAFLLLFIITSTFWLPVKTVHSIPMETKESDDTTALLEETNQTATTNGDNHVSTTTSTSSSSTSSSSFVTAGYLPDYRFYISQLNQTALHLTDLILFSIDMQPSLGKEGMLRACCLSDTHFTKAQQAVAYRNEQRQQQLEAAGAAPVPVPANEQPLRLWVSIGGAGRSNGYQALYNNRTAQKVFCHALLLLVRQHHLSGVDFDNEGLHSRADLVQYTKLLQKVIVPTLNKHEPNLLTSVTLHVGMTLPPALYQMMNRINLMAYDLPHAELANVEQHVDALIQSGHVDSGPGDGLSGESSSNSIASKIVLGFPAYGRHRQKVQDVKTFAEIIDDSSKSDSSSSSNDAASLRTTIDTRTEWQDYIFDSPQVVRQKALLAKQKGLAGVFMWELGQDKHDQDLAPGGFLARAMSGMTVTIEEPQQQQQQQQGKYVSRSSSSRSTADKPQGNDEL
jgi:chitinase